MSCGWRQRGGWRWQRGGWRWQWWRTGADGPHGLVGDHSLPDLLGAQPGQRAPQLFDVVVDVVAGLTDLEMLTDADDRHQAVLERGERLRGDQRVVLVMVGAPLGVADHDERTPQFRQESAADLAGVGARVVLGEVLGTVGQPQLVPVDQRLHAAQVGERRDDGDIGFVSPSGVLSSSPCPTRGGRARH